MDSMSKERSRDIIREALRCAAQAIAALPEAKQEASDREDMLLLLKGGETGRNGYIGAKALAYAIAAEAPDREEMVKVLTEAVPDPADLTHIALGVKSHMGKAPDLGPEIASRLIRLETALEVARPGDIIRHDAPLH